MKLVHPAPTEWVERPNYGISSIATKSTRTDLGLNSFEFSAGIPANASSFYTKLQILSRLLTGSDPESRGV